MDGTSRLNPGDLWGSADTPHAGWCVSVTKGSRVKARFPAI